MTLEFNPPYNQILPERWTHAYVERTVISGELKGRWEIIDLDGAIDKSGPNFRYLSESTGAIRRTCLAAMTVLPFYGAAYMLWHLVKAPFSAVSIFFYNVEEMMNRPSFCTLANLACQPIQHIVQRTWLVIRSPLCLLAMQSAALYGLVQPLEGRQCFASAERWWRGTPPFEWDFHGNYLVKSFQPYGTLNDPSIVSVQFAKCKGSAG